MLRSLDLERLRRLGIEGLMSAVSDAETWRHWEEVLAQAGMCMDGLHGCENQFRGQPVQPVVVWKAPGTSAETVVTYFVPNP